MTDRLHTGHELRSWPGGPRGAASQACAWTAANPHECWLGPSGTRWSKLFLCLVIGICRNDAPQRLNYAGHPKRRQIAEAEKGRSTWTTWTTPPIRANAQEFGRSSGTKRPPSPLDQPPPLVPLRAGPDRITHYIHDTMPPTINLTTAPAQPTAPTDSGPFTAKDRRRLTRMVETVSRWWQPLPEADRLPYYSPEAIERATGSGIQALAPALRAMGWERSQVRIVGPAYIVWVAPGATNPLRPIGRPRTRPTPTTSNSNPGAPAP